MRLRSQSFKLANDESIVIRHAVPDDAVQMAAVHLESFNQSYIAYPDDAKALKFVSETFRTKTLQGYIDFWSEAIQEAAAHGRSFVLVAETQRWMNRKVRPSIEAVANIVPVENAVWNIAQNALPEKLRVQANWYDYYLMHIRDQYRRLGVGSLLLREGFAIAAKAGAKHMFMNAFDGNGSPEWFFKRGAIDLGRMCLPYCGEHPMWRVTAVTDFRTVLNLNIDDSSAEDPWSAPVLTEISERRHSCSSLDQQRVDKYSDFRFE